MGKRYDARKMTELCDSISHAVDGFAAKAEMLENEYSVYNSNNTYRGEAANASKEFVYKGQGKLIKEQVRVLNKLSRKFNETHEVFRDTVDSSPNAKIDMDVLEGNKRFFSMQHERFEDKAIQLERVSREISDRFGRFGYITTIRYDRAKYGFEDLCGYSGFMNKCMRSFEEFDEETKSYLKSSGIDRYMYDIETDTKATMNALNGMAVYNPDVKKINMTPVAQMAAKMMNSAGIAANPTVSLTEGEKLLKLLKLENSANLHVDANIIKTATNYAVQMCPSKEGTFAIKKCSTAMLAVDGQTLKTIAEIAASFMAGAAALVPEITAAIASAIPPIAIGILIGAAIVLFVVIIYEVAKAVSNLFESSGKEKEIEKKTEAGNESKNNEKKEKQKVKSGKSKPPKTSDPDSVYEQKNNDGTVRSRSFYDKNGRQYKRQDFDHEHYDKNAGKPRQPHEHHYRYNSNGQPNGHDVGPITDGSTNAPSE